MIGQPPWEVHLELFVKYGAFDAVVSKTYTGQFYHPEGQSGYDRVLKQLFQRLNDDVLLEAVMSWVKKDTSD